ncbi:hypothetical protein JCM10213_008637 [Rhodosporidiobolus nylandii]
MAPPPLPIELIEHILAYLDPLDPAAFFAIAHASRVSSLWRAAALPKLFEAVTVYCEKSSPYTVQLNEIRADIIRQAEAKAQAEGREPPRDEKKDRLDEWSPEDWSDDEEAKDKIGEVVDKSFLRFLDLLNANPHLRPLVRTFAYYGKYTQLTPLRIFRRTVRYAPNIDTVRLVDRFANQPKRGPAPIFILRELPTKLPGLRSLTLLQLHWESLSDVFEVLRQLHNLEHFSFAVSQGEEEGGIVVRAYEGRLKSLEIGPDVHLELVSSLVRSSASSLRTLSLNLTPYDTFMNLAPLTSLHTLAVGFTSYEDASDALSFVPPNLRRLELRRRHNSRLAPPSQAFDHFLRALPATLDTLYIAHYLVSHPTPDKDESVALFTLLADPSWLPNLSRFDIADEAQREKYMWDDDFDEDDLASFAELRERYRKACEARGADLGTRTMHWADVGVNEGSITRLMGRLKFKKEEQEE